MTDTTKDNVKVRQLEWDQEELPAAQCVFGHYAINPWYHHVELLIGYGKMVMTSLGRIELGKDCSIDDLKAAAQADYEKRILAALDAAPKDNLPATPNRQSETYAAAQQAFADYFVRNYPGPDTVIFDPAWHAPKLFAAACRAIIETKDAEAAAIGRQRMIEECDE